MRMVRAKEFITGTDSPSGAEVDLTRAQFTNGEVIGSADVVLRPKDVNHGRLADQYRRLSDRVTGHLLP